MPRLDIGDRSDGVVWFRIYYCLSNKRVIRCNLSVLSSSVHRIRTVTSRHYMLDLHQISQ